MDPVIVNVILLVFLHLSGVGYSLNSYVNCKSCPCFPSNDTQHSMTDVQNILIDAANDRVIVGARDSLVRLDSSTLRLPSAQADFVSLLPTSKAKKTCVDLGFLPDQCFNYIRLLLFDTSGNIFTCGTFASQRRCWRFQRYGILRPLPLEGFSGLHRTPQDYHYAVTGTFSYQYLFTGIDNMAIYRSNPNDTGSNNLQTKISTSVLHEPKFVSSFSDPDNFVYFFLRERAAERSKTIYSRVARVCQYDEGAKIGNLKGIFTSFVKTRVLCSIPGEIPFDFDQIQATFKYYDPKTSRNYIYGIFTTPELGLLSSAVCMYSMAGIQELFQKSKYLQKSTTVLHDGSLAWVPASPVNLSVVPGRPKCNSDLKTKDYPFNSYTFAAQHPLLAEPLTSHQRRPLFVRHEMRFTQIVVDKVKGGNGLVTPVMFISTDNGTVFKVFSNTSGDGNAIIVEQIEVFEKPTPVMTMKLYKDAVFLSSYTSVVKLPVERCSKYQTCRTCVSAMDPYCGWSNNKCTTFDNKDGSGWAQDIAHGSYSKVCPEAPPVCSVDVTQERPGGTTLLRCQADGVPVPRITNWTKDSKALPTDGSFLVKQGNAIDQQLLEIQNFGMDHLGLYQCTVSSTLGSSSCAINVTGTLPVISSKLTKINYTSYFTCNATGLPTPRVSVYKVVKGKTSAVNADRVPLAADAGRRSYYCVAQNDFGSTFGVTTFILDKEVKAEVRLTSETWSSELLDEQSDRYKTLSRRIRTTVESAFANDVAFMGFEEISFSKGSVICKMTLMFAAQPSDRNAGLLSDLQQEVSSGKLGDFSVDKSHVLNVEPDVESVTTSPVPALPTTSPTTALRTVATPTTTTVTMVTSVIPEPTPEYRTGESMDGGLFAVAIITAILLSLILGCVLGVKFHSQVARRCSRSSANVESCDGAHDKSVEAVKYTKSPPREEHFVRNKNETQSKRNLLNKKGSKTEADDHSDSDSDSTGSAAGKLGEEDFDNEEVVTAPFSPSKSISPSASIQKTPRVKPSLENGSVSNVA